MSIRSKKTAYADSVIFKSEPAGAASWSEWSDSDLNAEPWDYPKSGEFIDPQQVEMPPSLQPTKWKRFQNLKHVVTPIVYDPSSDYPDLIVNNKHLLHSEFIRCLISTLINIQYCGRKGLQIENSSDNFSWNFADQCWQGWYHVYSLNKAGKGAQHRPIFNTKGRYVVRLFAMGFWRRIVIDDLIPVDKRGRPLLPCTANNNELWPMILAKAMLKIAALSWTSKREIVDCSLIACLTGWIDLTLNVSHLSPRDQWEFLTKYAKHFEWSQEAKPEVEAKKSLDLGKDSKKKSKTAVQQKLQVPEEPQPTLLFLSLEDMRDVDAEEIPGITPCWNHQIYVELSRDVPLDPEQVKPPLAKWKLHRWLDWAISRGLIDPSEYFVPIRHLLIVSPLRECKGDVPYAYDGSEEEDSQKGSSQTTLTTKEQLRGKIRSASTTGSAKDKHTESPMPDISLWGDFNKLSMYLREIHLFYRPKFFNFSVAVSDNVPWNDPRKEKSDPITRDGKKSEKSLTPGPSAQTKLHEYQDKFQQSRNEPLYLFVDSTEDKFFLTNLSTIVLPHDSLSDKQPRRNTSLIIEEHNWFNRTVVNKLEAEIKTKGTKSTVFQVGPGRHLLRLFISSEFSYRVTILSDTAFQIGNRLQMHDLMTTESESVDVVIRRISICVKKAFESFGTADYATELKLYYQSYMPDFTRSAEKPSKQVLKSIHQHFSEEFAKLLGKRFSETELPVVQRALRIFFLDPSIGRQVDQSHYFQDRESLKNVEAAKGNDHRTATIVQNLFRMNLVKTYKEIHDPSHSEHNQVKQTLLKVVELFNYDNHESAAQSLLRALIKRKSIYKSFYPWAKDLINIIQIQELKGRISNVLPDQWVPILRVVVNAPQSETVLAVIDLFTNLPNYTVRVFANDTRRELPREANNVAPATYRYSKTEYTILAYGRNDYQRLNELQWSLHITTIKGEPTLHWLDEMEPIPIKNGIAPLSVQEISNNYIPNNGNCIFKLVARIKNKCVLTLRLKTSYGSVMTKLRVCNDTAATVAEIEGGSTVILPLVYLEHVNSKEKELPHVSKEKIRRSKKSFTRRSVGSLSHRSSNISRQSSIEESQDVESYTQYFIEAFVRQDSWPLTETEWAVVMEAKSRAVSNNTKLRKSSTLSRASKNERPRSKQISRKSLELNETLEQPYWILQLVTDSGTTLQVFQDRSNEDKISELKRLWKTDESGRSQRGSELRERFLEDNCLIIAPSAIDVLNASITDLDGHIIESVGEFSEEMSSEAKRTLEPPADLGNYLPKLDLTIYMEKDDEEETSWVKTDFDEETLRNQRAMNVLDFEQLQSVFLEDAADLANNQHDKYRRLLVRYSENSADRASAIEEAYAMRRSYISTTKDTARSVKTKDSKQKK